MLRVDFKERLLECLGGPWPEPCPLEPRVEETTEHDGYRLEKVTYQVEPGERVPAYVVIPAGVDRAMPAFGRRSFAPAHSSRPHPRARRLDHPHHAGIRKRARRASNQPIIRSRTDPSNHGFH